MEIFIIQFSTDSNASERVVISFGYAAKLVEEKGGKILRRHKVIRIVKKGNQITAVEAIDEHGKLKVFEGDIFISTMPVKDLVESMTDVPNKVKKVAEGLMYRDFRTVGILLKKLKLKN